MWCQLVDFFQSSSSSFISQLEASLGFWCTEKSICFLYSGSSKLFVCFPQCCVESKATHRFFSLLTNTCSRRKNIFQQSNWLFPPSILVQKVGIIKLRHFSQVKQQQRRQIGNFMLQKNLVCPMQVLLYRVQVEEPFDVYSDGVMIIQTHGPETFQFCSGAQHFVIEYFWNSL